MVVHGGEGRRRPGEPVPRRRSVYDLRVPNETMFRSPTTNAERLSCHLTLPAPFLPGSNIPPTMGLSFATKFPPRSRPEPYHVPLPPIDSHRVHIPLLRWRRHG